MKRWLIAFALLVLACSGIPSLTQTIGPPTSPGGVGLGNVTNDVQTKAAIVPNTAPSAGQILVGNAGGTAYAPVAASGDATLSSAGALVVTKTNNVAFAASATTDTTVATNISSGALPAGRMPALTGDCTTSAGAVATTCTKINGTDQTTAWTTFTPTITCGTGTVSTYTTQLGRYKARGKSIELSIAVKVNAVGTCTGAITIASLPITTGANNQAVTVFDQTTLATLGGFVGNGGTTIQVFTAAGGNPTATDIFIVGGVVESN